MKKRKIAYRFVVLSCTLSLCLWRPSFVYSDYEWVNKIVSSLSESVVKSVISPDVLEWAALGFCLGIVVEFVNNRNMYFGRHRQDQGTNTVNTVDRGTSPLIIRVNRGTSPTLPISLRQQQLKGRNSTRSSCRGLDEDCDEDCDED